jgi:hypothetical protein
VREGSEEVARKLLRVDVVLVVSSVRAERGRSGETTARPSSGGELDCRRGILVVRAWVDGEELVRELRWDVAVPMEHGIVGVGRRRWLTTASRTAAEGWWRWSSGEGAEEVKCGPTRR